MSVIEYRLFDPKEDFVFKALFGTEENKKLLISLLNSILKGKPYINDLSLNNSELTKILEPNKSSRLDILATSDDGIKFNIEMQCRKTNNLPTRTLFYTSKLYTKDLKENEDYNKTKVISIWLFGENVTDRKSAINEAYVTFQKNDKDPYEIMTNNLRIIYLELDKYIVSDENIKYKLSKWVDFLKDPINLNKDTAEDEDIDKARKTLEYISTSKEERIIIEKIIEGRNDFYSAKNTAREEGKEEGLKEGKEEGLKEGKIEMAKILLSSGVDVEIIAKSSGLTIDEIKNLKD
jgi:predicted transposase/invertase (TIGR01784 family)